VKTNKQTAKQKVLAKFPDIQLKEESGEFVLYLGGKSGRMKVGASKNEDGAWQSSLAILGIR